MSTKNLILFYDYVIPSLGILREGHIMAIRPKNKSSYEVYWRNPHTGKMESKTYPTKEEAEKENSLILHRLRYERESFTKEVTNEKVPRKRFTLEEVFCQWKETISSPINKRTYEFHMRPVLKALGGSYVDDLTQDDLSSMKTLFLQNRAITQATVRSRLILFRAVIYFAVSQGYREAIKFPVIPSAKYKKFVPPSIEELKAMYEVSPEHIRRVLILGAFFGVRIGRSELFKLTWDDVDLGKQVLRVHGSFKNENALWREVPIRDDLIPVFKEWKELDGDTQYLISFRGKPVQSIKRAWKSMLERAGITRRIRPYDLRHTFGTQLLANGADIGTVASLMGHSNPQMLLTHYQYVLDEQKKSAINRLPKLADMDKNMDNQDKTI